MLPRRLDVLQKLLQTVSTTEIQLRVEIGEA
jgi:hypothetical protein